MTGARSQVTPHNAASAWPELNAPAHWRNVEFISDLHLQPSETHTFAAWCDYMATTQADAVFILGDLFEVWVGDDVALRTQPSQFEAQCQHILADTGRRLNLYFMHGNRDFLLGSAFANTCNMHLLADPTVLIFDQQRWLLSHGDALCLDDVDYQTFRAEVRTDAWQNQFLAQPLAQRQAFARGLRQQSEARKHSGARYADLDGDATLAWLWVANASTLIHGHTHKPGHHALAHPSGDRFERYVLSDWDAQATPARLEVLQIHLGEAPKRLTLASRL